MRVCLCVLKTHIYTSTFLAVFFMTLRKTAVITGSSNGYLSTHISLSRYKQRQQSTPPLMNLEKLRTEEAKEKGDSSWMSRISSG